MILVLALIGFAFALGLFVKRVGLGLLLGIAFFTSLSSVVFLFAYFKL